MTRTEYQELAKTAACAYGERHIQRDLVETHFRGYMYEKLHKSVCEKDERLWREIFARLYPEHEARYRESPLSLLLSWAYHLINYTFRDEVAFLASWQRPYGEVCFAVIEACKKLAKEQPEGNEAGAVLPFRRERRRAALIHH